MLVTKHVDYVAFVLDTVTDSHAATVLFGMSERILLTYHVVGGVACLLCALLLCLFVWLLYTFRDSSARCIARRKQRKLLRDLGEVEKIFVQDKDGSITAALLRKSHDSSLIADFGGCLLRRINPDGTFMNSNTKYKSWWRAST